MTHHVTIEMAKDLLEDLIRVASRGEEVVLLKNGQPVARILPADPPRRHPKFGSARGLFRIAEDFAEPLEDFRPYT